MEEGKYKVFAVSGGWRVFYVEGDKLIPDVGRLDPFSQRTHAYRRARKMNRMLEEVNKRIAREGAIIL